MSQQYHTDSLPEEAYHRLEDLLGRMRRMETDGVDELLVLAEEYSDNPSVLGHLAGAWAYRGDHQRSLTVYERLELLSPGNPEIPCRMGDRYVSLGELDPAQKSYEEARARGHEDEDVRAGIRYVEYLRRKRPEHRKPPEPGKSSRKAIKNAKRNEREYQRAKLKLQTMPPAVYLESTLKCNFACPMCSKGHEAYYAEDLHENVLSHVNDALMPYNTRICITGFGEPTMASNFDAILHMAIENGSLVNFTTNASLLNYERIEQLTSCPVEIIISIDGATKETFEKVRVNSNFPLILEKLAMIKKLRDIRQSHFTSHFSFHFVGLSWNIHELPDVVRLAHRYGIGHVGVLDYSFQGYEFDKNSLRFIPKKANHFFAEARRVADELGVSLHTPENYDEDPPAMPNESMWTKVRKSRRILPVRNRFPRRCESPWKEPYIHTDGTVTPCCASTSYLGNVARSGLGTVWNGWRYRLFRWRIESAIPPMDCRKCFNSWGINGGNTGNVMAKEGLLIKGWYWLEYRFHHYFRRLLPQLTAEAHRDREARKPNYYRGKPAKGKQRAK